MIVKSLKINNLRNLSTVDIALHPRLNFFVGDNGAGKTSVLESLVVLAKGRSFRSGQVDALVGPEGDAFRVVTQTSTGPGHEQTLGLERSGRSWSARHNREDVAQLSDLAAHLPLVLIEPNSHLLVSGPPEGRRRFMDWGVFHVEHGHLLQWRRYGRTLKQRNAALRQRSAAVVTSLDPVLAELGERIHEQRQAQCAALFEGVGETLGMLSPGLTAVELEYQQGWSGESLAESLGAALERDMERGGTGAGPHRGDIAISRDGVPARETLSRGEQKAMATALLLTQAKIMANAGKTPLLLMDDLASEFDPAHLSRVLEFGRALGAQVWVTGTGLDPYRALALDDASVFHVEHGQLSEKTSD
ncbi:MAG: DNA replication/repair protein RecF [Xanthomonadales bacterium]|nr:DNA replication/repair protein RecF [Xanthomonadales bacterium]